MSTRTRAAAPIAVSIALAAVLSGCGGNNAAACDDLRAELKDVTQAGLKQLSDPAALEKTYSDGAAKMRATAESADGDVQSSAKAMADSIEKLGHETAQLASGTSTTALPDTAAMEKAADSLEKACN